MYETIRDSDYLCELNDKGFHNPYFIRKFEIDNMSNVEYLINNFLDEIAFGIKYKNKSFSLIKKENEICVRNNSNHRFEFPHCPPPVSFVYDLKCNDVAQILKFINEAHGGCESK